MYPELLSPASSHLYQVMMTYPDRPMTDTEYLIREIMDNPAMDDIQKMGYKVRISELTDKSIAKYLTQIVEGTKQAEDALYRLLLIYPYVLIRKTLDTPLPGDLSAMLNGVPRDLFYQIRNYCNDLVELLSTFYTPPSSTLPYLLWTGHDAVYDQTLSPGMRMQYIRLCVPPAAQMKFLTFCRDNPLSKLMLEMIDTYGINKYVRVVSLFDRTFIKVIATSGQEYVLLPRMNTHVDSQAVQ